MRCKRRHIPHRETACTKCMQGMHAKGRSVPAQRAAWLRVMRPAPPAVLAAVLSPLWPPLWPAAACGGTEFCSCRRAGFLASSAAFLRFTSSARPLRTEAGASALAGGSSRCEVRAGRPPADPRRCCERSCRVPHAPLQPVVHAVEQLCSLWGAAGPLCGLSMELSPLLVLAVAAVVGGFACRAGRPLTGSAICGGAGRALRTRFSVPTHAGTSCDASTSALSSICVGSRPFCSGRPASTCTWSVV